MNNSRSTKKRRRLASAGGVAVLAASLMALDVHGTSQHHQNVHRKEARQ